MKTDTTTVPTREHITLTDSDKHNRTKIAHNVPGIGDLEIVISYTGQGSAEKAVPLDGELIPRIVACVNSCADLPDPAVVPELRQHLSAARASLDSVVGNIEHEIAQGAMPFGGSTRALLAMLRQDIARINATLGNEGYRCGKAAP